MSGADRLHGTDAAVSLQNSTGVSTHEWLPAILQLRHLSRVKRKSGRILQDEEVLTLAVRASYDVL